MIERFGHGGDLETAQAVFGVERHRIIDFSANINPLGPPAHVVDRVQQALAAMVHYPDPDHRQFRSLLSKQLGLTEAMLCIGNGAAECMALAILAVQPKRVGVVYPCFSEYAALSRQFGAEVEGIVGTAEQAFLADADALLALIDRVDMMFLGQPNNPTGVQYDTATLRRLAKRAAQADTLLVIDEAFIDFMEESMRETLVHEMEQHQQVILIRSMTKFYAIPGLRLGYAIAHPTWIERLKSKQVTWSVNSLALAAGEACLVDCEPYEALTREQTMTERQYLVEHLEGDFGCQTWPSMANFILVRLPSPWTAEQFQQRMGRRGILIRNCSMYEGLTERDIRVAVKHRAWNKQLIEHMAELWKEGDII